MNETIEIDGWIIHDWGFDHAFQSGEMFIFEEDLEAFHLKEHKIHVVDYANYNHISYWDFEANALLSVRVERVHRVTHQTEGCSQPAKE